MKPKLRLAAAILFVEVLCRPRLSQSKGGQHARCSRGLEIGSLALRNRSNYFGITSGRRVMKSAIVRIGNSKGVRIPKSLLEQAGITGPVELWAEDGRVVVERAANLREGWEDAARQITAEGGDELLLGEFPNDFDADERTW